MRTRGILNKLLHGWKAPGHAIYRQLESALIEAGLPANDSVFRQIAFMNAFQRPAKTGASIRNSNLDIDQVIKAIQPDHVVFVSTKAKKTVGKRLKQELKGVHHPACPWWNRKQDGISSKQRFIGLISGYVNAKEET